MGLGDTVVCRHGVDKLVEYCTGCGADMTADDVAEAPCAVLISVDGLEHKSEFKHSGKGTGGARLQRPPISFGP